MLQSNEIFVKGLQNLWKQGSHTRVKPIW
jgi:hypothetical protein